MTLQKIKSSLNQHYPDLLFFKHMDLQVESLTKDKAVLSLACNEHTLSPYGAMFGGVVSFAADVAIWNALLTRGENPHVVTTDLNMHYLERLSQGRVRFMAEILKYGTRIIIGECKIYNAKKVLAAHATASFLRLDT